MTALANLPAASLETLASALETGRLTDFSQLQLRNLLGDEASDEVTSEFDRLSVSGFSPAQIAKILRIVAADRREQARSTPRIELVWTGPGSISSTSRDTGVVVRELFSSAERSVLVAGFAVHRGREIFRELAQRMSEVPSLDVTMFFNIARGPGDTTLTEQLVARFASTFRRDHWSGARIPAIYYDPRALQQGARQQTSLHAKCIVVDGSRSFVTSANFTEAAQDRNIEVGALIHDPPFAQSLTAHFRALVDAAALVRLPVGQ